MGAAMHQAEGTTDPAVIFRRADGPLQAAAASRLVEASAAGDPDAGARFLEIARLHALDLRAFWVSMRPNTDTVRHVCLCVPGAGRTGMFFTSEPSSPAQVTELSRLIRRVCDDAEGVLLAQSLLAPREEGAMQAFGQAGFQRIGPLSYLRRPVPRRADEVPGDPKLPSDLTCRTWRPGDDPDLMAALSASYIDTRDCPELCGLRPIEEVLDSHRSTGTFDARYWWVVRLGGRAVGAMLFNLMKAQASVELVYMGLAPEIRGRGVGSRLLAMALRTLSERPERYITCAVDHRNLPARRLYERFGFAETTTREAFIRSLGGT